MTGEQMRRLTENLKRDGVLTSYPLVYSPDERLNPDFYGQSKGKLIIVSGNHRVEAARNAGFDEIPCIRLLTHVPDARLRAIQLSHNSISGQDDQSVLQQLYDSLDLDEKLYSGLTDDDFNIEPIDLSGLGIGGVRYSEVTLAFIPRELDQVKSWLSSIEEQARKTPTLAARYEDFDQFFDAVVKTKTTLKVYNSAIAVAAMVSLAMERLEQLQAEEQPDSEASDARPND
jgi:hypothetical protein